ncbi:MAG: hypothetical protein HY014_16210 [Acidobacteria bacterium]|nr:hypothetical protein [Acidobacteriota bacterium]MBI3489675.1 hypothetical protein [Acidobacteriota bacterium]
MKYINIFIGLLGISLFGQTIKQFDVPGYPYGKTSCSIRNNGRTIYYENYKWIDPVGGIHEFPGRSTQIPDSPKGSGKELKATSTDGNYDIIADGIDDIALTVKGAIYPKYQILSLVYAPPGPKSAVTYGTSSSIGSKNSTSETIGRATNYNFNLNALVAGASFSANWKTQIENSSSTTITSSTNFSETYPGPQNAAEGLNHDYDCFIIWLNPKYYINSTSHFNGSGNGTSFWYQNYSSVNYDERDPAGPGDIIKLYVKWLKNPTLIQTEAPGVWTAIQRTWAGQDGELNGVDFAAILGRNPYWNGSSSTVDKTRFDLQFNQVLLYEPPAGGGQPSSQNLSLGGQTTSTLGQTATDSYSVSLQTGGSVFGLIKYVSTNTWDFSYKWSREISNSSGYSSTASITGPNTGYTGPVRFQVYKDNIFGTFMFFPIQ